MVLRVRVRERWVENVPEVFGVGRVDLIFAKFEVVREERPQPGFDKVGGK